MTETRAASEVSEPVSDVQGMANLNNTRRWLVEDGEPLALGFVAVGDSLLHTNPIVGRGCSLAWTAAFALAECLESQGDDLRALALAYHERVERDLVPWYELQLAQDADSIEVSSAQQRGEDPFAPTNADGSPIEFVHTSKKSLIAQREIGADSHGFLQALRASLRQDPDVILVGEMRDIETVRAALSAAETGHLVLATLHTVDAQDTINRIVDFFTPHEQAQIRATLSQTLRGIVSQRLVRRRS